MPFIKVWIHLIWSTKNRYKTITKQLKPKLITHIRENAKSKNIYIDTIECVDDHIHMLISLKSNQALSNVVRLIKGESSHWVNQNNLAGSKFEWQEEFIAISVSESLVPKVRDYIKNQFEHHRIKTFEEEYTAFMEKYGFQMISG